MMVVPFLPSLMLVELLLDQFLLCEFGLVKTDDVEVFLFNEVQKIRFLEHCVESIDIPEHNF